MAKDLNDKPFVSILNQMDLLSILIYFVSGRSISMDAIRKSGRLKSLAVIVIAAWEIISKNFYSLFY